MHCNRRHRRAGHLVQHRYKSIVCDAETYSLALTRYIHRVLGGGAFVTQVLAQAARQERDTLRLARTVAGLPVVAQRIAADAGLTEELLRSARRGRPLVRARRLFCQVAVTGLGHSGAAAARFLGVTTSAVTD